MNSWTMIPSSQEDSEVRIRPYRNIKNVSCCVRLCSMLACKATKLTVFVCILGCTGMNGRLRQRYDISVFPDQY